MKVKIRIEGYINVDEDATEEQIEEAVYFSMGMGALAIDNPVQYPDWDSAEVDVIM